MRDYIATQFISGKPILDFESFRTLVQVAVESITNRALAGELDSAETTGTNIQLMNYSYTEDAALPKGASSKNRYKINHVAAGDTSADEINAFKQFQKFNKFRMSSAREAKEDDICYNCDKKGHFARNCPRNILTKGNGVYQVGGTNVPGLATSSESEDTSSDEDPTVNYVKNTRLSKKNPRKYHKYPRKAHKDRMHAIIESQTDQIASLSKQLSEISAHLASKPPGSEASAPSVNVVNFPDFPGDILDINKGNEDDIFHFL